MMENLKDHPTQVAINELTLALLYLTRFGNPKDRVYVQVGSNMIAKQRII